MFGAFLFILLIPVQIILRGTLLTLFWGWFISGPDSPFYPNAPDIAFTQALGISLVVSYLVYHISDQDENEDLENAALNAWLQTLSSSAIFLLFASVYHYIL